MRASKSQCVWTSSPLPVAVLSLSLYFCKILSIAVLSDIGTITNPIFIDEHTEVCGKCELAGSHSVAERSWGPESLGQGPMA